MKKRKKKPSKVKRKKPKKSLAQRIKNKRKKSRNKTIPQKRKIKKNIKRRSRGRVKAKLRKNLISKITKKKPQKTRVIVSSLLRLNDKVKSILKFNINLDQTLQRFFNGISEKVSGIRKIILEEREKQKKIKLKIMEQENADV